MTQLRTHLAQILRVHLTDMMVLSSDRDEDDDEDEWWEDWWRLDSLFRLQLTERLQTSLGYPLPSSLLFDYLTLDSLVAYLAPIVGQPTQAVPQVQPNAHATERSSQPPAIANLCDLAAEERLIHHLDSMRY